MSFSNASIKNRSLPCFGKEFVLFLLSGEPVIAGHGIGSVKIKGSDLTTSVFRTVSFSQ